MEQFVLGIFQEQLAKLIVGFRKEQVNANLLNGKGEITNVSLNCSILNESIAKVSPFFELESVRISKLSFNVTSWTNLKKAPLCVVIEDIHAVIVEPLRFIPKDQRRSMKQISRHEYKETIKSTKQRGSYSLLDRILDNLKIEIRSVNISFQPRGKFKTRQTGPWTPPSLQIVIRHVLYQMVNEFGNPASPDDCWRHNTCQGRPHEQKLRIFKSMDMVIDGGLKAHDKLQTSIIQGAKIELQIIFQKRVHDAAILSIQADMNVNQVEVLMNAADISTFAHAVAGFKYCFAKDRGFQDPLLGGLSNITKTDSGDVRIKLAESSSSISLDQSEVVTKEFDDEGSDEEYDDDDDDRPKEYDNVAIGDFGVSGIEAIMKSVTTDNDQTEMTASKWDIDDTTVFSSSIHSEKSTATLPRTLRDRPVIIFPTGIVIHESVSVSLSIHNCTVRCTYADKNAPENSFVKASVKGLVAEIIWPKSTGEKGLHLQISMSYISMQELFGDRIRFLMVGGLQHDLPVWPVERSSPCVAEILSDENFPIFIDRCIQPDSLRFRHTFPAQAVGIKSTVSYVDNVASPDQESVMVLNEVGLDQFEISLDMESWCRTLCLLMNETGGGFDPRWNSGDWSDLLTTEMLVHPSQPLNLVDHVQETIDTFLDANKMMSSDLFNVTGRIRNVNVRVPAALSKDVRSCDIVMKFAELMLVISSALPRTFLIGKLGSTGSGDDRDGASLIEFPNDPSDICYELERTEDLCIRQERTMTAGKVSTFRTQISVKDLSLNLAPAIPFCNHAKPQELVAPFEFTLVACFEGEPPESAESNLMKLVLFLSVQIHRMAINCDFDLMSGAASTSIHHVRLVQNTVANITKLFSNVEIKTPGTDKAKRFSKVSNDSKVYATTSRNVTTRRQFQKSRETGGLTLSLSAQLAEVSVSLWRQNVPMISQFRASEQENCTFPMEGSVIPLLQLIKLHLIATEVGIEAFFRNKDRRVVLKCCLGNMKIDVCDFDKECSLYRLCKQAQRGDKNEHLAISEEGFMHDPVFEPSMIELVLIGRPSLLGTALSDDISVRVEERVGKTREMSSSVHIGCGAAIYLHVQEVETTIFLVVEALLLPTGMIHNLTNKQSPVFDQESTFPIGSIGEFLSSFAARPTKKNPEQAHNTIKRHCLPDYGDKMITSLILSRLPGNISTFLNRVSVNELFVLVPRKPRDESSGSLPWYGLFLTEAVSLTGFFAKQNETEHSMDQIIHVKAHRKSTWDELFVERSTGLHQTISMVQSVHAAEPIKFGKLTHTIIPAFTVQGKYLGSKFDFSLGDSTLTVLDIRNLTDFYCTVTQLVDRTEATRKRVEGLLAALKGERITKNDCSSKKTPLDRVTTTEVPDVEGSFGATKAYLNQLSFLIAQHEQSVRLVMSQQQKRVEALELQVFSKERARLAALALVASQAAGWLRIGGSHIHGQRTSTVANMWRYFVVLRKSLMILYAAPGMLTPLDIVSLQGARLHVLTGGRKRSDVRHGFAIVENTGKARLFIALNGSEYDSWLKELHIATTTYSEQRNDGQVDAGLDEDFPVSEGEEYPSSLPGQHEFKRIPTRIRVRTPSLDMEPSTHVDTEHTTRRPAEKVRASFSNLTAAAKSKLAVARENRKRTKSDNESGCDDGVKSHGVMCPSKFGIEDIVPLSPILHTKSSADHSTPLEVIAASEELGENDGQENAAGAQLENQEPPSNNDENNISTSVRGSHVGKRFASLRSSAKNRVSGAVQAAMEKTKAVAEQRKNQKELQLEDVDGRQQSQAGDTAEGGNKRRLGGLKNRLGGVTLSMTKRLDKTDDSIPVLATDSWDTAASEQPKAVDDVDSPFGNAVEQTRDVVTWGDAQREIPITNLSSVVEIVNENVGTLPAVVESSVLQEKEDEESTGSGKARPRFGARVKNLGDSIRSRRGLSPKVIPQNHEEEKGRFSIRGRFTKQNGLEDFGADFEETTIRGVNVGDSHQIFGEPCLPIPGIPLEKIGSAFIVQVVPYIFQPGEAVPSYNNLGPGSRKGPAEIRSVEHSFFDKVKVPENQLSTDGKECTTFTLPQNGFKIARITNNFLLNREMRSSRSVKTIFCTFTDILSLYTSISDSVAVIGPMASPSGLNEIRDAALEMKDDLVTALGLSTLDYVKVTGSLLGGLIGASKQFERLPAFCEYECEILTEFLNSTLNCPLPEEARRAVTSFLRIEDYELPGCLAPPKPPANDAMEEIVKNATGSMLTGSETILALTSAVQTEVLRAEAKERLSQRAANAMTSQQKVQQSLSHQPSALPYLEPLLPSIITDGLRKSLHEALILVMAERDEAHARMVAASVMHVHEVEQERKKVAILVEKLMIAQALAASFTNHDIAGFVNPFQNNNTERDKARKESEENLKKLSDRMLQNTDIELIALCEQLSGEIASKTSKSLEILRLHECRKVEKELDLAEKQALQAELKRVKEALVVQQVKLEEARHDTKVWKEAYDELEGHLQILPM